MDERVRHLIIMAAVVLVIGLLVSAWARIFPDWLWFSSIGPTGAEGDYASVYKTILLTKIGLGVTFTAVLLILTLGNLYLVRKLAPRTISSRMIRALPLGELDFDLSRYVYIILTILAILFSLLIGYTTTSQWEIYQRYINADGLTFNMADPLFNKDVSYYMFRMPFEQFLCNWGFGFLLLITLFCGGIYFFYGAIFTDQNRLEPTRRVRAHLFSLIAVTFLFKAWQYRFAMYELLHSTRGYVYGAGYADEHARLPVLWILLFLSIICAVLFIANIFVRKIQYAIGIFAIYLLVVFLGGIYPATVQRFKVDPNEKDLEEDYIANNIKFTRAAYNLDRIVEQEYPLEGELDYDTVTGNKAITENIRLWDNRPLRRVFQQLQELRPQYDFVDVDNDRYQVQNQVRQVMLSARELDYDKLQSSMKSWVNKTFVYTHGYGVCMSPVNEIIDGSPKMYIKDLPVKYEPEWTEYLDQEPGPRIYYGELTLHYVVVNPRAEDPTEFDGPGTGVEGTQAYREYAYQGKGGVPISSFWRRLAYTWKYRSYNLFIASQITRDSRILYDRNITGYTTAIGTRRPGRAEIIAPFLKYDGDPYVVIAGGRLYWIIDAYTTTNRFPYSEPMDDAYVAQIGREQGKSLARRVLRRGEPWGNYIRNSVKVVIDAYDGSVDFYRMKETHDPLVECYSRIFPGLFRSSEEMPEMLRAHIRYPMTMFMIQAQKYQVYHMKEPNAFYLGEDIWDIAQELYGNTGERAATQERAPSRFNPMMPGPRIAQPGGSTNEQRVDPYYVVLKLPDEEREEFMLMLPFTPARKKNMTAWLTAKCDLPDYGNLLVYRFPRGKLIPGPLQVEVFISQEADISRQLSLWDTGGSQVIRGNLLVIPIANSILYVEPLYIQSDQANAIPKLERVIVGYGEEVAMGLDLYDALRQIFQVKLSATPPASSPGGRAPEPTQQETRLFESSGLIDLLEQANTSFEEGETALKNGDWVTYGKAQQQLKQILKRLVQLQQQQ